MMWRSVLALAVAAVLAACGGDDWPKPESLSLVTGDAQSAPAGARLPRPLVVIARAGDGATVARAAVRWRVVEGVGAAVSDSVTVTDGLGEAQVWVTLGPTAGDVAVRAELVERRKAFVDFAATATEPPAITAIEPSTFAGGEEIVIRGSRLFATAVPEIGGVPAAVTSRSPTGLGMSAIAPRCLPVGAVSVRVVMQGASSNVLQGTYTGSPRRLTLAAGEYVSIDAAALDGCTQLPPTGAADSEYLVVPQAATGEPGVTAAFRFAGDSAGVSAAPERTIAPPLPFAVRFHDRLRALEREQAHQAAAAAPAARDLLAAIEVGDEREFRVCADVNCTAVGDFKRVKARARFVGRHAAFYVDLESPQGGPSETDLATFGALFDDQLYPVAARYFGAESDVDRNGRVIILMTPVVNRLSPKPTCETSFVTGFFHSIDLNPAFQKDERSNRGEIFYTLTADPSGSVSCAHSFDRIRQLVPVTFIHEFQHMVSYHQHVLLRKGDAELVWLNEALSHLAEELAGRHFLALGDPQRFSQFVLGDLFNAFQFLKAPDANFLVFRDGQGSLAERGAGWLFLTWLMDRYGPDLPRLLSETDQVGAPNVERATGGRFATLVAEWVLANYVSDLTNFTAPQRLRYAEWDLRATYRSLHEQLPARFDVPFPLVPALVGPGSFAATGTLRAGSGSYVRVVQTAGHDGFTLSFTGPDGTLLPAATVPRLTIVRIR